MIYFKMKTHAYSQIEISLDGKAQSVLCWACGENPATRGKVSPNGVRLYCDEHTPPGADVSVVQRLGVQDER